MIPSRRKSGALTALIGLGGLGLAALLLALGSGHGVSAQTAGGAFPAAPSQKAAARAYGHLPLRFEANRGQTDSRVDFLARGAGYTMFLTPREAVLSLTRPVPGAHSKSGAHASKAAPGRAAHQQRTLSSVLRIRLLGAEAHPRVGGLDRLSGATNYLKGADRSRWRTGVRGYGQVRYSGIYPGVDLLYHGRQGHLEYDFNVAPRADTAKIELGFRGAKRLTLDRTGSLIATTRAGTVREPRPVLYQRSGERRRAVSGAYVLHSGHRVGFRVGRYDHSKPLVIDPEMAYAGFLGGATGSEHGTSVAADSAGHMYVTGGTSSTDFPTTAGAYQPSRRGYQDAFVTKLNPAGDGLVYSTYLGGNDSDGASGIALDSSRRAYIVGQTSSSDFPTSRAFQSTARGSADGFLSVLKADGSGLDYSSYLGGDGTYATGDGFEEAKAVALDSSGNAYVTGTTQSANFPTKSPSPDGPLQGARGGPYSPFAAKLNPNLDPAAPNADSLVYSTYLGGSAGYDFGGGIAVDGSGNAYLEGTAGSDDFPTTAGAFDRQCDGGNSCSDLFVSKLNPQGSALVYSTYLGGDGASDGSYEYLGGNGIAVDSTGHAFVTGYTTATDFPMKNPFQGTIAGDPVNDYTGDAFVTKLNPAGSDLDYSSYLGGRGDDYGNGIALDGSDAAYVVGDADVGDVVPPGSFPAVDPVSEPAAYGDAFVSKVRPDGSGLAYSTNIGGGSVDDGAALAVDDAGSAYITGVAVSTNLPTRSAFQSQPPSGGNSDNADALVVKLAATGDRPLVTRLGRRSGPEGTAVTIAGHGFSGASAVRFGAADAQFSVTSDTEISATAPAHGAGPVAVTVTTPAGSSPPNPIATFTYAPGTWDLTGSLVQGRSGPQAATRLSDGTVLVAGGCCDPATSERFSAAELYSPSTGEWKTTGSLATPREGHSATLLSNGKVLVAGGYNDDSGTLSSTELYDPATGTWSSSSTCGAPSDSCPAPMATPRYNHSATLLSNGKVLVAGGSYGDPGKSAELYDPASGTWSAAGSMRIPRSEFAATLLDAAACHGSSPPSYCGKVLVDGGPFGPAQAAELYDPSNNSWSDTDTPSVNHVLGTNTLLPNGKVLVAGGEPDLSPTYSTDITELYDPATGQFSRTGTMIDSREYHAAALLRDGRVLVAGGFQQLYTRLNSTEIYDPASGRWAPGGPMAHYRYYRPFAVPLSDGKALVGGDSGLAGATTELFTPASPSAAPPLPSESLSPPPPAGAPSPSPGAGSPILRPVLSGLHAIPARFAIGSLLPHLARRTRVGTTIHFSLSRPATVRLTFARRRSARRYVSVHASLLIRGARPGDNRVRFQGRLLRRRTLRPGHYRLTAIAIDASGNRSKPKRTLLTVTRRPGRSTGLRSSALRPRP